jgi:peptide/nickel transport system substrate-binding protein
LTFTIQWSSVYVQADRAQALTPMPRHLLEGVYTADGNNFLNSPRLTTEFIGLGPYRLARWESGISMEFAAFDDYYLGRPPLDGIIVRYIADPNAMIANILAEAVDVLMPVTSDVETVSEVRRRWEGTGHQVLFEVSDSLLYWEIQHRIELARPRNGLTDRTARQALYHAIDRATLTEVVTGGFAPAADSWIAPTDALRPHVESAIPQFPFDVRRAEALLAQAGWLRGRDGVLVHQASGDRFELMLAGAPGRIKDMTLIGDGWKTVGVEAELYTIPPALDRDREHRSTLPGVGFVGTSGEDFYGDRLHSNFITSASNRWSGSNRGGYSNPRVDALLERLGVTIEPSERLSLHHALLQEQMGDVALMPLYWRADMALALKRVHGVVGRTTWNVHEWRRD